MGKNTYMISKQAATGFTGLGTLKAEAIREASAFCEQTNKRVKVNSFIDGKPPFVLGNFPRTEIYFSCIE